MGMLDEELLVPDRPTNVGAQHVAKRAQRNRTLEVVFDPKDHKQYLTGFRKRKQQRRKDALSKLEKQAKQQRLEERAERRQALKEQFKLEPEEEEEQVLASQADDVESTVKIFSHAGEGFQSTVRVSTLDLNSEDEPSSSEGEEDDKNRDPEAAALATHRGGRQTEQGSQVLKPHKKLTKAALKTMERTRLKLQGKSVRQTSKFSARKGLGKDKGGVGKKGREVPVREGKSRARGKGGRR